MTITLNEGSKNENPNIQSMLDSILMEKSVRPMKTIVGQKR